MGHLHVILPIRFSTCEIQAKKAKLVLESLESEHRPIQRLQNVLREIETEAYRAALDLADIEIADTCDVCPVAPPTTKLQAHLLVLADVLEQQASLARECAQPAVVLKAEHNGRNGHQA
jgi:hypothetical protein